jgi:hypothetical protein
MKLREAVSWFKGTLQRNLIPGLEECCERPLTEKEQQLVSILELVHIEKFVGRPARRFGRKRRERQGRQSVPEALAELPVHCAVGTKKNSQGYKETWRGLKWHADVSDCCLPISVALTAASLHDSQVAIPLAPHEAASYKERTVAERFNSRLKEEFGGGDVMVRGAEKVGRHLMFGV